MLPPRRTPPLHDDGEALSARHWCGVHRSFVSLSRRSQIVSRGFAIRRIRSSLFRRLPYDQLSRISSPFANFSSSTPEQLASRASLASRLIDNFINVYIQGDQCSFASSRFYSSQ
jgi:hypothetical protein